MGAGSQQGPGLAHGVVGPARVIAFGASNVAPAGAVVGGLVIVVSYAGFASPLVVLIAFAASLCCASSIGEFARRLPSAGSLYTYNSRGLGRVGGFLTGWMMIFAYALYVPAGIALTSAYAAQLLADTVHVTIGGWALFVVILAAVAGVAYLGIGTSSSADLVLVAGEVAVFAALAITVLVTIGPAHYSVAALTPASSPNGQLTDITNAMIYGITAFAGYEAAAALGEEARSTRRSIPASTIGVVIVTGLFFLLVIFAEVLGVGRQGIPGLTGQASPLGYLASRYWSPSALWAIDLVVVLTGLGFVIAALNAAIRVLFAMGRERALPAFLARLSHRHTPAAAIGCVAVLALALGLPLTYATGGARTFGYLAGAGGLSVVLVYLAVNIAAIRAFRTEFRAEFRLWRHLLVPATAAVLFLFPLWGSSIRAPTAWWACCPSRRSGGSASGSSPPASCGPGSPPASRRWAGYSCPPQTSSRCHDRHGCRSARGRTKRLWNAGLPASKLDSGLCLVFAGVLRHRCCPARPIRRGPAHDGRQAGGTHCGADQAAAGQAGLEGEPGQRLRPGL